MMMTATAQDTKAMTLEQITTTLQQVRSRVNRIHEESPHAHPSWVLAMTAEVLSMLDALLAASTAGSEGRDTTRRGMAREVADRLLRLRIKAHNCSRALDVAAFTEDLRFYADYGRWPDAALTTTREDGK